jgi:hypothetical protein
VLHTLLTHPTDLHVTTSACSLWPILQSDPSRHHQSWQAPNDPQRHHGHQRPTHRSRRNKYGAWKKPASEPKHYAPNTSNNSNNPAPRHAHKTPRRHHKWQGKNDQHLPQSHQQSEMLATQAAATMASQPPKTPKFAPRANSRSSSSTTSAK